ncbi:RluA family pseudouridine synthase [Ponticaulis profundi]|uniref:Pseudouridine synthase n=1 Tax=Ponticaulis profundi TaxID=2665222 RepID=A0ABW1S9T0_9PROT
MTSSPLLYQPPATDPLPILYQDDWLMIVDKPAGLLSVPGRLEQHKDSLALRLDVAFPGTRTVHRLDMDTSGLMVFARDEETHRSLSRAFERKQVDKKYTALVHGVMAEDSGWVELPLIKDWPNRPKQKVDFELGKPSRTEWSVLSREDNVTRVELIPITGRTHQLRVHMAEIGHGILGDCWYGSEASMSARDRLCLHAGYLGFQHPATGEPLQYKSEADF